MRSAKLTTSLILVISILVARPLIGQNNAVVYGQPTKTPPTLPVLYRHFLAYQLHLERKADALKLAGKDGEDLRTYYQKRLGFSDQEFAKLHGSALHLEQALKAKDSEAQQVVKDARASIPKGPLPTSWRIPPPPARLKELQAERDAIINQEMENIHKSLTPAESAKLDDFLRKDFAPTVTVGTVPPPFPASPPSLLQKEVKR